MRIADMGSGNTSQNNYNYIKKMINAIAEVDPERKFILKWQIFKEAQPNIPLFHECFEYAYKYAEDLGYKTTASVFDKESLDFLLQFDPCFVKIANRPDLYWLIGEVPNNIDVIVSYTRNYRKDEINLEKPIIANKLLYCISEYPTTELKYRESFFVHELKQGISDHTNNFNMYLKYKPEVYEFHFKLPNSTGLDAGEFARTPEQIKEVYEEL